MIIEEDLFEAAADLPEADRAAYLDSACDGQPDLRARVEALLRSHEASGFMERNALAGDHPELVTPRVPEPPGQAGERIGHYRLREQIGEGGFGVVWVAEQTEPVRRRVALKIIKPGMDSREVIARFGQERQALAMMDHPNIAKVFDAGATDHGRPYFVMELVRGVKMTEYCDEANLPLAERLKLFIAVCHAVQHAHQKGIIHRDLKPSNILVAPGDDGQPLPKVIDFGVAKAVQQPLTDDTVYTQFEQMIGTPAYMSPEQAGLGPMDIDTRSDVYSLGVLLYELLTGKPPFDSKELLNAGPDEMRRVIREVEPPKPSTRRTQVLNAATASGKHPSKARIFPLKSSIDPDLDWIVMKALEKDRARRYETANGLTADIQRFLNHEPVNAGPPRISYRVRKFIRKHRGPVLASAAVVVTLLAGLVASTTLYLREKDALGRESMEKARVRREAAKSQHTANFLKGILSGIKPSEAKGEDTKLLRKLMERAEKQLDEELSDQPDIRMQMHMAIGDVCQAIGNYSAALRHREETLKLAYRLLGPEDPLTLLVRDAHAGTLNSLGRAGEAERERRETLALQQRVTGQNHRDTLDTESNLAGDISTQGRWTEAEAALREVLQKQELALGPADADTLQTRHNLGTVLLAQHRYAEAETVYLEEIKIQLAELGPEDQNTLESRNCLAVAVYDEGRYADAEALFREIIPIRERVLGSEHPDTLWSRTRLANALLCQDNYAGAESEHRAVLSVRERTHPADHPDTLYSRHCVANCLHYQDKCAEAEVINREVCEALERTQGRDHPDVFMVRNSLAGNLLEQKKFREALAENEALLAYTERTNGPVHPNTLIALYNIMNCYRGLGELEKAREYGARAVEGARSQLPADHPIRLKVEAKWQKLDSVPPDKSAGESGDEVDDELARRANRASALRSQGNYVEAEAEARKLLSEIDGSDPEQKALWLAVHMTLASALRGQGKPVEAERELRESIPILESFYSPGHPKTLKARANLANALFDQDRFAETETECREVLKLRLLALTPTHPDVLASRQNLANALSAQGNLQDAEREYRNLIVDAPACFGLRNEQTLWCRLGFARILTDQKKFAEAETELSALYQIIHEDLNPGHPLHLLALRTMARNYAGQENWKLANEYGVRWRDACRTHLGATHHDTTEAETFCRGLDSRGGEPASPGTASPSLPTSRPGPEKSVRDGRLVVAPDSAWKWLHPMGGVDPEGSLPGFHKAFPQPEFDDAKWHTGKDSDDPNGGFGYDLSFAGVDIGKPEEMNHRRTAYFRHTFKTTKAHNSLELRCRRDDGIIVYLDGREIFRDNMEAGPESYQLTAAAMVDGADEQAVQRFPVPGVLGPGTHTLAISVHNTAQASSDLRLGGVTLVEVVPAAKKNNK